MRPPAVIVVAGPTASGKSAFALREGSKGVIINGDSQQLFSGLSLLTAQPSHEDRLLLPHYLYEYFPYDAPRPSVYTWLKDACCVIDEAHRQGIVPWVVGGTGFYLEALLKGLVPLPDVPAPIQEELRHQWEATPSPVLYQQLQAIDPVLSRRLSPMDKQRIIRGLTVHRYTGQALSVLQSRPPHKPPYQVYSIVILPPRETLEEQFSIRWGAMVEQGVLEEVAQFCQKPNWRSSPLYHAIGLREIHSYLQGEVSRQELDTLYICKTRQYAKRQRCWFRNRLAPDICLSSAQDILGKKNWKKTAWGE